MSTSKSQCAMCLQQNEKDDNPHHQLEEFFGYLCPICHECATGWRFPYDKRRKVFYRKGDRKFWAERGMARASAEEKEIWYRENRP